MMHGIKRDELVERLMRQSADREVVVRLRSSDGFQDFAICDVATSNVGDGRPLIFLELHEGIEVSADWHKSLCRA